MSRRVKQFMLMGIDSIIWAFSIGIATLFLKPYIDLKWSFLIRFLVANIFLYLLFGYTFRIFSKINRYTSFKETLANFLCISVTSVSTNIIFYLTYPHYSYRFGILSYLIVVLFICGSRFAWRALITFLTRPKSLKADPMVPTLIVGAGDGAEILMRRIEKDQPNIDVVGFVDDDCQKQKMWMYGKRVLGGFADIPEIVDVYDIKQISIAVPSLEPEKYEYLLDLINPLKIKVNRMPSFEDMLDNNMSPGKLQDIDVSDLLGRKEIELDMAQIADKLAGKVILVTGAGGSIGSEICRQVCRFHPKRLILLGHGENSIYLIHQELKKDFKNIDIVPVIADVQDRTHIFELLMQFKPDVVYHAAAHKHVPMMEANPTEAIKNNVYGTKNIAEAAKNANVKSFVMISTDKAVNPPNIMGATKRMAEMIVTSLNEEGHTNFAAVRFGNVLGSRGSVVPLFKKQIAAGGPVTVTDLRMTRFFMTIPEASRLVIQAGSLSRGGELFILDMGKPVKIVDLAKKMIKLSGFSEDEIEILESGMRPGEKLYEELLVSSEKSQQQVFEKIFLGKVTRYDIQEIMSFVESVKDLRGDELKEVVIHFANTHNGENKSEIGDEIKHVPVFS